jgi:hypothetical protein
MARKSNIIIFRAEESKKTEPKERKVEDISIQLACQCPILVVSTCGGTLFVLLDQGFNFI